MTLSRPLKVTAIITIAVLSSLLALSSCTTTHNDGWSPAMVTAVDTKLAAANSKVRKYCTLLEAGSAIASTLKRTDITVKINAAVDEYCDSDISDVPTALAALSNVYQATVNAGIKVSVAAN